MTPTRTEAPNLGDLVVVLLASTLAGLRERLHTDGFDDAAELVGDLVEIIDDYLMRLDRRVEDHSSERPGNGTE